MDIVTREYINKVADAVRSYYSISTPIEDMVEVVTRIGGRIEEKLNFDSYYDGTIIKDGMDSFCIAISPIQNAQRKNFTIAHELGHLFLHMGYKTNQYVWNNQDQKVYRRFGMSEQEYQANEFAAALLMPKDDYKNEVSKLWNSEKKIDIGLIASKFNVSISAAFNRGRFLGILE